MLFSKCCCNNPNTVASKFVTAMKGRTGFPGFAPPSVATTAFRETYNGSIHEFLNPTRQYWDGPANFTVGQLVKLVFDYTDGSWITLFVCIATVQNATSIYDTGHFAKFSFLNTDSQYPNYSVWNDTIIGELQYNTTTHLTTRAYSRSDIVHINGASSAHYIAIQDIPLGTDTQLAIPNATTPDPAYWAPYTTIRNVWSDLARYFSTITETTVISGFDAATGISGGDGTYVRKRSFATHYVSTPTTITNQLATTYFGSWNSALEMGQFPNAPTWKGSDVNAWTGALIAFSLSQTQLSFTWLMGIYASTTGFTITQTVEVSDEYLMTDLISEVLSLVNGVSLDTLNWSQSASLQYDATGTPVSTPGTSPNTYSPTGELSTAIGELYTYDALCRATKATVKSSGPTMVASYKQIHGGPQILTGCANNSPMPNTITTLAIPTYDPSQMWLRNIFAQGNCASP